MPATIDEIEITPQVESFWGQSFLDESVDNAMSAVRALDAKKTGGS